MNDKDAAALDVGMSVLGGLASSRLDNALVRGKQVAVSVSAEFEAHEQVSFLEISMDVKPGVPRAKAEAALDAEIARFLATGPNADEVKRAATRSVSAEIGSLEVVGGFGGKGTTLAEGLMYSGDPAQYKRIWPNWPPLPRRRSRRRPGVG
jgi:predicted Zn-dependent peptidase